MYIIKLLAQCLVPKNAIFFSLTVTIITTTAVAIISHGSLHNIFYPIFSGSLSATTLQFL